MADKPEIREAQARMDAAELAWKEAKLRAKKASEDAEAFWEHYKSSQRAFREAVERELNGAK